LLIFIGLIDIWLFWGGRFWGCFFKLFWFVVKLFSIIWSEAVEEDMLVRESKRSAGHLSSRTRAAHAGSSSPP
jgi:hypothetical protein